MSIHVLCVPTHVTHECPDGVGRWCFTCRKRRTFTFRVHTPDDPTSCYGPHFTVRCDVCSTTDGDLFPGTWREWDEDA